MKYFTILVYGSGEAQSGCATLSAIQLELTERGLELLRLPIRVSMAWIAALLFLVFGVQAVQTQDDPAALAGGEANPVFNIAHFAPFADDVLDTAVTVRVNGRDEIAVNAIVSEIAAKVAARAEAFVADISSVSNCAALIEAVEARVGRIDILVNNAGICPTLLFGQAMEDDWDALMNVNARSRYFLMQFVCPILKRQGGGRIINLASAAGRGGSMLNASIHSGTRAAILMFSKSVAREVAADGILVNCVAPGPIKTDMQRNLPADRLRASQEQFPLKRFGEPEEVAAVIAFLASDECSFCTGATFDVNGGWIML